MGALVGPHHNPVIQALYIRLRAAGKTKKVAMMVYMHKLSTIMNAMVRDCTPGNHGRWLSPNVESAQMRSLLTPTLSQREAELPPSQPS